MCPYKTRHHDREQDERLSILRMLLSATGGVSGNDILGDCIDFIKTNLLLTSILALQNTTHKRSTTRRSRDIAFKQYKLKHPVFGQFPCTLPLTNRLRLVNKSSDYICVYRCPASRWSGRSDWFFQLFG